MYRILHPLIFRLNPERAHDLTVDLLRLAGSLPPARALLRMLFTPQQAKPVEAFGLRFENPVGLAAGYDKDGLAWRGLACLGFGHLELGTVTPKAQPGNPSPRIFRLPEAEAVINRMGFPGKGADFLAGRLAGPRPNAPIIGINIGKNKATPLETAAEDYVQLTRRFAPLADYLAVNVSSPNTAGLRDLQGKAYLEKLLGEIGAERDRLAAALGKRVPVLVKLAPDLTSAQLADALEALIHSGMDGVIATNTTIERTGLEHPYANEQGGLSGAPLRTRSTQMIAEIYRLTNGKLPIVGVGGIISPDDAAEKLDAGATLVQIYTGLIYAGPGLAKQIVEGLNYNQLDTTRR